MLAAHNGRIVYHKAFGYFGYDKKEKVSTESVYDMASVTKICGTALAVMKLYEEGKINLRHTLGHYLDVVKGTNKEKLIIENILLHQAGLSPFIQFYKETTDSTGRPLTYLYSSQKKDSFSIPVACNLFLRNDWRDTIMQRILQSPVSNTGRYVYSDNDFIFLGKIVEVITGTALDKYVQQKFYMPLGLSSAGFMPLQYLPLKKIAPTEEETVFRKQLIRGYVHDPGAAMFGGVAGHAGLFSNAYDMAILMQLLLNGGTFNGKKYLQEKTIRLFTSYQSAVSRRGLGFDKPEKDNDKRAAPYPCLSASPAAFGHTGFTGSCVWADPKYNLVYVFLSNRVSPDGSNTKLLKMNVRTNIQEAIYTSLLPNAVKIKEAE